MHIVLVHFTVIPTPAYEEIAAALRLRGHSVWVGSCDDAGNLVFGNGERVVTKLSGPVGLPGNLLRVWLVSLLLSRLAYLGFMVRVHLFLRQLQPNIVQVNPARAFWVWLLPLFMPGHMRFVLDLRQLGQSYEPGLLGKLKGWLNDWARRTWATSIYDRVCFLHPAGAKKVLGESWSNRGRVVPMGVDQLFLDYPRPELAKSNTDKPVQFLYVGTLSKVRQLDRILFALEQVLSETKNFEFVFLGPDHAQKYYHRLLRELKLDSNVIIQSPVPYKEIPRFASSFDVALAYVPEHPSDWQFHPTIKILEYRALGIPIIATDYEPNRDFVEDSVNGVLVINSVECLAATMLRFIVDRDFLKQCWTNARLMRQGVTWNEVAEMYEQQVYMPLLNDKGIQESIAY